MTSVLEEINTYMYNQRQQYSMAEQESVEVGDVQKVEKKITEDDVEQFAQLTLDNNPLHTDEEYAEETIFGGRIAHGALLNGLVSATLAAYPGTVVYISQESTFLKPVYVGTVVTAVSEVIESLEDEKFRIKTEVLNEDGEVAIHGEAVVMIN